MTLDKLKWPLTGQVRDIFHGGTLTLSSDLCLCPDAEDCKTCAKIIQCQNATVEAAYKLGLEAK